MAEHHTASRVVLLTLPGLVLVGYGWFVVTTYLPYLNWHAQLRSPQLGDLPEDVIGYGFWMWWPFIAVLFVICLAAALSAVKRRLSVGAILLASFAATSIADYWLCKRLVRELIRPYV
jgi:hypothetical protein